MSRSLGLRWASPSRTARARWRVASMSRPCASSGTGTSSANLAPFPARLEHVGAYVARDAAEPRLDRSFTAKRGHRAMGAKQRLLHGLVGIGLGAEQRHARPTEHVTVLACACRECFAVGTLLQQGEDRIGAWLVSHQ